MNRIVIVLVAVGIAIGAGGYWLGRQAGPSEAKKDASGREILYYRNPMGEADTSKVPKKDSMGMAYIPVYKDEAEGASPTQGKGKILYYRNPMGAPDTSPVPKKDSMGMDYIPVYEGDQPDTAGTVKVSPDKIQKLGVQSAPVALRTFTRTVRAVGTVQADERKLFTVNTKFDGWITKLHANATGQFVRRGEPLMEVYAPDLVAAEEEYLVAVKSLRAMAASSDANRATAQELTQAALRRLRNWDISDDQIKQLEASGTVTRTLTLRSPATGTVMEKMAVDGARFMAGEALYRIADLSSVWVLADVFEQDLGALHANQTAKIVVNAYPGETFSGTVEFIYPTVSKDTRTGKVRVVIPNPDGRLKTDMYANVLIDAATSSEPVLTIPESAVIDGGTRQSVLIDRGDGKFEPREVKLGGHGDGIYEVREGLRPGDKVVTSANFLIDAESNLQAALKAFTSGGSAAPSPPQPSQSNEGRKQ